MVHVRRFAELRRVGSKWFHGDTYLFAYDHQCNVLFNAAAPQKEGSNVAGHEDKNGSKFHDALVVVASTTPEKRGWVTYWWPRPGETQPSQKWTYSQALSIDGVQAVLMSGFYV